MYAHNSLGESNIQNPEYSLSHILSRNVHNNKPNTLLAYQSTLTFEPSDLWHWLPYYEGMAITTVILWHFTFNNQPEDDKTKVLNNTSRVSFFSLHLKQISFLSAQLWMPITTIWHSFKSDRATSKYLSSHWSMLTTKLISHEQAHDLSTKFVRIKRTFPPTEYQDSQQNWQSSHALRQHVEVD